MRRALKGVNSVWMYCSERCVRHLPSLSQKGVSELSLVLTVPASEECFPLNQYTNQKSNHVEKCNTKYKNTMMIESMSRDISILSQKYFLH